MAIAKLFESRSLIKNFRYFNFSTDLQQEVRTVVFILCTLHRYLICTLYTLRYCE